MLERLKPTTSWILPTWKALEKRPFGKRIFSRFVSMAAPYTATIGAEVEHLEPGRARVTLRDRPWVRNHLRSIHAVALANLGEMVTGLATISAMPEGSRGIVKELGMEYLKKARGTITGEANVVVPSEPGRHELLVTAQLSDARGEVVAVAKARWVVDNPAR